LPANIAEVASGLGAYFATVSIVLDYQNGPPGYAKKNGGRCPPRKSGEGNPRRGEELLSERCKPSIHERCKATCRASNIECADYEDGIVDSTCNCVFRISPTSIIVVVSSRRTSSTGNAVSWAHPISVQLRGYHGHPSPTAPHYAGLLDEDTGKPRHTMSDNPDLVRGAM
jgi:hypothetical protein